MEDDKWCDTFDELSDCVHMDLFDDLMKFVECQMLEAYEVGLKRGMKSRGI